MAIKTSYKIKSQITPIGILGFYKELCLTVLSAPILGFEPFHFLGANSIR
jgi:hypothetical protein